MEVSRELLRAIHDEIGRAARASVARFTRGGLLDLASPNTVGHVPPTRGGTGHEAGAEPPLGNPPVDGHLLSSTAAGVRSWVPGGADGGYWEPVTNGDVAFPEAIFDDGDIVVDRVEAA